MADLFVSYARSDEQTAARVAQCLSDAGYQVWRDDQLPAHRAYSEVIEERLKGAKAVIVLWSAEAAKSQWVRAEADAARIAGTLVQATSRRVAASDAIQPDPVCRPSALDRRGGRAGMAQASRQHRRACAAGDRKGRAASRPPQADDLRPAVPEHERRHRAGIFQRRDQRGHHHRPLAGLRARGRRPQYRLHLQGAKGERVRNRPRAGRQPRPGRQRAKGGAARADHRAAHRRRHGRSIVGRSLRPEPRRHLRHPG